MAFLGYFSRRTFFRILEGGAFKDTFFNVDNPSPPAHQNYGPLEGMLRSGERPACNILEPQQPYIRNRIVHELLHSLLQREGYTPSSIRAFETAHPASAISLSDSYVHRSVPFSIRIDLRPSSLPELYKLRRSPNLENVIQSIAVYGSGVSLKDTDGDDKGAIEIENLDRSPIEGSSSALPLKPISLLSAEQRNAVREFDTALLHMLHLHYTGAENSKRLGMSDNPELAYQKALERLSQLFPQFKAKRFS